MTALMFTFCICFLMYSGTTFQLLENLVTGLVGQTVAADLMASVPTDSLGLTQTNSYLNERRIAEFLSRQNQEDGAVVGWSFVTADMRYIFNTLDLADQVFELADGAGFETAEPWRILGVQQNMLNVINDQYLSFSEVSSEYADVMKAQGKDMKKIDGGSGIIDAVDALFTEYGNEDGERDAIDTFNVRPVTSKIPPREKPLGTINVIVPEGLRDVMSLNTTTKARLRLSFGELYGEVSYRARIVGMAQQMTGFYFTRYRIAQIWPTVLMSDKHFGQILLELRDFDSTFRQAYEQAFQMYEFENNAPKNALFVKLNDTISEERRLFITNGIRSFFQNDQMILMDLRQTSKAIKSSQVLFQLFLGILGAVALTLSYYLLRVSTLNTIRESVWEYGQMRAIGLRQGQGMSVYIYEQFVVILSSIMLGVFGGLLLACISTAQFILLTEYPFKLLVPWEQTIAIIIVALLTTFLAVYRPIKSLNEERIADMLKGLLKQTYYDKSTL